MGRTSPWVWALSATGCFLVVVGLALALEAKLLGDSTQVIGLGVGLAGVVLISLVRGLDVFKIGRDGFDRE